MASDIVPTITDFETDNRDLTTTEIVVTLEEKECRIEVNPVELYRNVIENAHLNEETINIFLASFDNLHSLLEGTVDCHNALDKEEKVEPNVHEVAARAMLALSGAIPEEIRERVSIIFIVLSNEQKGEIWTTSNIPEVEDVQGVRDFLNRLDVSDFQTH